ncbi:GAF and ANTAR domain-containing protein [Nocardioides sp.]|uniref:GAF and ANTAR domain-containing protein n=1 Tax=Nocardioides sp. TaxID=35761 RepID=UPI003D0E8B25
MSDAQALSGLADVSASLVGEGDISGVLASGLARCAESVGAQAAGLLVVGDQGLELLSATSHAVEELEALQVGSMQGPCVDCVEQQIAISAPALEPIRASWPLMAEAMERAGLQGVYCVPLHWQGRAIGGLNLFWSAAQEEVDPSLAQVAQAFADIMSVAIISIHPTMTRDLALDRVRDALAGRAVIEVAKGVLVEQHGLEPDAAFSELLRRSAAVHDSLGAVALRIIDAARRPVDPG